MGPDKPLPYSDEFADVDAYVDSLLQFATSSWLLQTLCGGVHILDLYTRTPDLYSLVIPKDWQEWFKNWDIQDLLDLFMREDLSQFDTQSTELEDQPSPKTWRGGVPPPAGLVQYLKDVRRHSLGREFTPADPNVGNSEKDVKSLLPKRIAVGMKVKKIHEVGHFANYVNRLAGDIAETRGEEITHLVDFGSGQNYLGRTLASPPYNKHIVAVEGRQHNIEGAKSMDILAKLAERPRVMRNKKEYKKQLEKDKNRPVRKKDRKLDQKSSQKNFEANDEGVVNKTIHPVVDSLATKLESSTLEGIFPFSEEDRGNSNQEKAQNEPEGTVNELNTPEPSPHVAPAPSDPTLKPTVSAKTDTIDVEIDKSVQSRIQYVEALLESGDLSTILTQVPSIKPPSQLVISLHSCGNLSHHGLRSLVLNPTVSAVALIGCCYNLLTERLTPPTTKHPALIRSAHPRIASNSSVCDPHGFPMSNRLLHYESPFHVSPGVRLNITARMMAVQAPQNWGPADSAAFFTRHFYRALLQRLLLDEGMIPPPPPVTISSTHMAMGAPSSGEAGVSPAGTGVPADQGTEPIIIGPLPKRAYTDFVTYVRAAMTKLVPPNPPVVKENESDPASTSIFPPNPSTEGTSPVPEADVVTTTSTTYPLPVVRAARITSHMLSLPAERMAAYETSFAEQKKSLSVLWSLMAVSAGVVEAVIVVDRWLWLREQANVGPGRCWVEPVFDYGLSPRNLVVVGVKKGDPGES